MNWHGDSKSIGLAAGVRTDLQDMRDLVANGHGLEALELYTGDFLCEPIADGTEIELWRTTRSQEALRLMDQAIDILLRDPATSSTNARYESAIDRLLARGVSSPLLLVAKCEIHRAHSQLAAAELIHERLGKDYPDFTIEEYPPPSGDAVVHDIRDSIRFIGRDAELEQLRRELLTAIAGSGRVVVVTGEPGIGKTRIATQLLRIAALKGARVWSVNAQQATRRVRRASAAALLANSIDRGHPTGREKRQDILAKLTARRDDSITDLELLEEIAGAVDAAATEGPLVLFVDDVQWLDEFSAQLLMYIALRAPRQSLLVLMTLRTREPTDPPEWVLYDLPNAVTVDIGPLGMESAAQLLAEFERHRAVTIPPTLKNTILLQTAGRPLLLLELLVASIQEDPMPRQVVHLPATAESVLARRFRNLPYDDTWLYGAVAVAGTRVCLSDLCEIVGLREAAVGRILDRVTHRGILELKSDRVAFPHDLLREVAYRSLATPTKVLLHRRLAEYLLTKSEDPGIVAQHYAAAGDGDKAAEYALAAADKDGRFADREFYLELAIQKGSDGQRHTAALLLARHFLRTRRIADIERVLLFIQDGTGEEAALLRQFALLGKHLQTGDTSADDLITTAVKIANIVTHAGVPEFFPTVGILLDLTLERGGFQVGRAILNDCVAIATEAGDPRLQSHMHYVSMLWTCIADGYVQPLQTVQSERLHAHIPTDRLEAALLHFAHGTVLMLAGELHAAKTALTAALDLSRDVMDFPRAAGCCANLGIVLTELGDYQGARKFLEEGIACGNVTDRLRSFANLAICAYEEGDFKAADATCLMLLQANEAHQAAKYRNTANAVLGLCAIERGDLTRAHQHYAAIWPNDDIKLPAEGEQAYIALFGARFLAARQRFECSFKLIALSEASLRERDMIGMSRVQLAKATVLGLIGAVNAYTTAKELLLQCERLGAKTLAQRVRPIMERTRA